MTDELRTCIVVDEEGRGLVLRAFPDGIPAPHYGVIRDAKALFGPSFEREGESHADPKGKAAFLGGPPGAPPTFFSKTEAETMIAFLRRGTIVEKTAADAQKTIETQSSLVAQANDLLSKTLERLKHSPIAPAPAPNNREIGMSTKATAAGERLTISFVAKKTTKVSRIALAGPGTLKMVSIGRRFWMLGQGLTEDGELEPIGGAPDGGTTADEHTVVAIVVESTDAGTISAIVE